MTHATKAIYKLLLSDYVKVSKFQLKICYMMNKTFFAPWIKLR